MRWVCILLIAGAAALLIPGASAANVTLAATPAVADIGDVITINGTISGISTIAVYLFVTGPGLDSRGVTLENLNIPAGRGLFTTAPVNLSDGSFSYRWDTSVILGTLQPGTYTIYVVSSPVDRLLYQKEDFATTTVEFQPEGPPPTGAPVDPVVPVAAVGTAAAVVWIAGMRKRKD